MTPPPAGVRYNEWHRVELPPPELFRPSAFVSVVVPYFEQPAELERTLAALERQTWPRELFEVVVVDDGSKTPLAAPVSPLRVTVVHQEDRGFGLARARNTGAETAAHDILLFLDADMLPDVGWIGAHARWHQTVGDAVTLGSRAFVAVDGIDAQTIRSAGATLGELFAGRPRDASFVDRHMARTRHLTATADDQFRVLVGSNFGIRRELFEAAGRFDETFTRWGGEDTEFGYRAQTIGGLMVPVADGLAWHQGRLADDRERKDASFDIQRGKLAHLIAHHEFRDAFAGRTFAVPQYVVTIDAAHAPRYDILDIAERILGGRTHDLVLRIEVPGNDERLPWLREHLGPDPRIRVAPQQSALGEFPAAAFHVRIPATVRVAPDMVQRMRTELGVAVAAVVRLSDQATVSIARAWALHRARRNGVEVGRFGDVRPSSARRFGIALAPKHGKREERRRRLRRRIAQLRVKVGNVRSPQQAWWLLAWLAGVVRWRLAKWERFRRRRPPAPHSVPSLPSDPLLGVRIAAEGAAAEAVLGPHSARSDAHVDVLLTDAPRGRGESTVSLADAPPMLSVPAFDAGVDNPIGWIHAVTPAVGTLGPLDHLPTSVVAQHVVDKRDGAALRSLHHLEDVAEYHAGAVQRAGELARLAAQGVVVHLADGGTGLRALLGDDLHRLMLAEVAVGDLAARERLSIEMRRAALRDHALASRVRQIAALAMADPPPLPLVSILLASKRPGQLRAALAAVARQTYPRLELVFAAHGDGFADLEPALESLPCPWRLVRVPASRSFGGVLNAATEAARGTLLAKMDDDDLYATEHIWDLVLAHDYSKAELVGKGLEYVYLADADRTLRRSSGRGESLQTSATAIAGGALLISRQDLQSIGGWRRVNRHVDLALRKDVAAAGGRIYRTHGAGFMLVRRGQGDWHTWKAEDGSFLVQAESNTAGWRPDLASLGDIPHPSRTHSS